LEESTVGNGASGKVFYWIVITPVPPEPVRVATFSHAIPETFARTDRAIKELQRLETRFAPRRLQKMRKNKKVGAKTFLKCLHADHFE
jgi:hypothetical protein